VDNLADSLDGHQVTAAVTLANTILAGAPGHRHDLVNQLFTNAPNNQATVANPSSDRLVPKNNIITTAIANLDAKFDDGVSGPTRGSVSVGVYIDTRVDLRKLQNNGGWSETMALGPRSFARNAGVPGLAIDAQGKALRFDQRGPGYSRVIIHVPNTGTPITHTDIGAWQGQT
jgi:hypothetical protein